MTSDPHDEPLRDEAPPDAIEPPEAADASELEQLREEAARNRAGWQRAQADYENLKRRSAEDVRRRVERSQSAIFDSLVDLADDFRRAIENETSSDAPLLEGVQLIERKLIGLLERNNVYPIAAVGVPFDTNYHEAMGSLPGPHDQVVAEVSRGWLIGDRVLRASKVMVGADPPNEQTVDAASEGPEADAAEGDEPCRE